MGVKLQPPGSTEKDGCFRHILKSPGELIRGRSTHLRMALYGLGRPTLFPIQVCTWVV